MKTTQDKKSLRPTGRRVKTAVNLAYPLIEAAERQDARLNTGDEWNGVLTVRGSDKTEYDIIVGKTIDIEEVEYLFMLDYDAAFCESIHDALLRTAEKLGYNWDNDNQRFVEISE